MPKSNDFYEHKNQKIRNVYLDYAAATPIEPTISSVMQKIYKENFANPSSIHSLGVEAGRVLEKSRKDVALILGAHSHEVIFTSGSTESNNLAIFGVLYATEERLPHIVTTNIEHSSILEICRYLERINKAKVTYMEVEANGIVHPEKIKKALNKNTVLVSVMYGNSEIGTIQPIREIAKEVRHFNKINNKKIIFHTDATQAVNYLPIQVLKLGVDLMSMGSVKFYGPRGIGMLYIKRNTAIRKIMQGGDQQFDLRSGSYNLPGIVGFAEALKLTEKIKEKEVLRLTKLRDYFFAKLQKLSKAAFDSDLLINGDLRNRLPNNINITIPNIPSDLLVIELSARGIMASAKSACKSGDGKASYVIKAINKNAKDTDGSLRFSLGRQTTKAEIDYVIKALVEILKKLKKWYK